MADRQQISLVSKQLLTMGEKIMAVTINLNDANGDGIGIDMQAYLNNFTPIFNGLITVTFRTVQRITQATLTQPQTCPWLL